MRLESINAGRAEIISLGNKSHRTRPGIYFRVLNAGEVLTGDAVTLVESTEHDVSILDLYRYKYRLRHAPDDLQRLLEAPIAERMRVAIEKKLEALS